jgi:hypothetical protein
LKHIFTFKIMVEAFFSFKTTMEAYPLYPTSNPQPIHPAYAATLSNLQPIHINTLHPRRSNMRRQPRLRVLIVERPRRHDSEEGNEGARKADVQRERNVLGHEADEEGDDLSVGVSKLRNR